MSLDPPGTLYCDIQMGVNELTIKTKPGRVVVSGSLNSSKLYEMYCCVRPILQGPMTSNNKMTVVSIFGESVHNNTVLLNGEMEHVHNWLVAMDETSPWRYLGVSRSAAQEIYIQKVTARENMIIAEYDQYSVACFFKFLPGLYEMSSYTGKREY